MGVLDAVACLKVPGTVAGSLDFVMRTTTRPRSLLALGLATARHEHLGERRTWRHVEGTHRRALAIGRPTAEDRLNV